MSYANMWEYGQGRVTLSHADLVERAGRWLRTTRRCGVVLTERRCAGSHEVPDAIGWARSWWSILVECKATRSDFLKDRKKFFRNATGSFGGSFGMGQRRFYMTPSGLMKPEELPEGWGLVEVHGSRCKVIREASEHGFDLERCRYELALLYSFARRTQLGVEPTVGCLVERPPETIKKEDPWPPAPTVTP